MYPTTVLAFPQPPDNRVLIAQVTVPTGTLYYWLNISVFDEGVNQLIYVHGLPEFWCEFSICPGINGLCMGLVYPLEDYATVGCQDYDACNYGYYDCHDESYCIYPSCTDPDALNYDANALCENNTTCIYCGNSDFNNDGEVNSSDLLMLMSAFGCLYDCEPFDLNCDGVVNIVEIIEFIADM